MALGKVETISEDPSIGTIIEDESGQVYAYNDPNFPKTGLKVGDACSYDIDYAQKIPMATNLLPYVPTETVITTDVSGPITVKSGETLKVKNGGKITGSVIINNGNLFIQGTGEVDGDVTVNEQGSAVVRNGGKIKGNVIIASGSAFKVKNGGTVRGNIIIAQANRIIIGDADGGGNVTGSITIDKIRKVVITETSKINCG